MDMLMCNKKRPADTARREAGIEPLEGRLFLSTDPAVVLTKANRQTLLTGMNLSATLKNSLQGSLNSNNLAAFDTSLLNYMTSRTNAHFFFDIANSASIATYITSNVGDGGAVSRANQLVSHVFPSSTDSTTYTVNVGTDIDWTNGSASTDPNFLHTLNRMSFWMDLSQAYRYTGTASYAQELIKELADWSTEYPTAGLPAAWSATNQKSWLLDMGVRVDQWIWSYFQLLGSAAWTKEANSLFLFKTQQQLVYMSTATTYPTSDNRSLFHATAWLEASDLFPEFAAADASDARALAFSCLDGQYYNDG